MRVQLQVAEALYFDYVLLARKDPETSASLQALYTSLVRAQCYSLGDGTRLTLLYQEHADLLQKARKRATPARILFLDYIANTIPYAALLVSPKEACPDETDESERPQENLELYVFHYDETYGRWIWPFIGMRYGPGKGEVHTLAVFDQKKLQALSQNAQNALVRDHSVQAAVIFRALTLVRAGLIPPIVETVHSQDVRERKPTIHPSSFAKRERTQHKKHAPGKGRRRS